MNNLYDVLEVCLQEIESGADVDTVLFRYPEFEEELRPILETSVQARALAAPDPSDDVLRRNKAKVLQQAAQMRETRVQPARRLWSVHLRRVMVSLAVLAVLFVSSTSLVRAASSTLPGDNLYPVKRTWEDMLVLLTFNTQARQALEVEHENERLQELNELFAKGRAAEVEFAGTVTSQNGNLWLVSNIPVQISSQTELEAQAVRVGDAVRVEGITQADGTVLAEKVELLPAGIALPSVDDEQEDEIGQETPEHVSEDADDNSNQGPDGQTPDADETPAPEATSSPEISSVDGVVESVNGSALVVNGQSIDIEGAEIKGTPRVGAAVKVDGYFDASGVFIVTRIEFQDTGSDSSGGSDTGGSDDNGNDDNGDSNSNDDGGSDDNGGDGSGGGGGNSGSGGGGDD